MDTLLFTRTPRSFSTKLLSRTDYPAAILWQDGLFCLFLRWPRSCFTLENFVSSHKVFCSTWGIHAYNHVSFRLCCALHPFLLPQNSLTLPLLLFAWLERLWRVKRGKKHGYPGHHSNEKSLKESSGHRQEWRCFIFTGSHISFLLLSIGPTCHFLRASTDLLLSSLIPMGSHHFPRNLLLWKNLSLSQDLS